MGNGISTPKQAANLGYIMGGISVLIAVVVALLSLPVATRSDIEHLREQEQEHRSNDGTRFNRLEDRVFQLERRQDELAKWQIIVRERLGIGEGARPERRINP